MSKRQLQNDQAERAFLQKRISLLPDSARLTKASAESRLREIDSRIASAPLDAREPARAAITFSGRPVVDSYGIVAEFGFKAVNTFCEAVAAMSASQSAPLAAMGPIPQRDQSQLLITNTALGSFGFELEEYNGGQLPLDGECSVGMAIERTQKVLKNSLESDEELAESLSETDARTLSKVRDFLEVLVRHEAIFTLRYKEEIFRFASVSQVSESLARLSSDNVHEETRLIAGSFQGALPDGRTFEFLPLTLATPIRGKIISTIADPAEINRHLGQAVTIAVHETRIGTGRPRFKLVEPPVWDPHIIALPHE